MLRRPLALGKRDRQEAGRECENEQERAAVKRERRSRIGGVESDRQHDAWDDDGHGAEKFERVAEWNESALDHVGSRERQQDGDRRG